MQLIHSIIATAQFEMGRMMTLRRLAVTGVLATFPPLMMSFMLSQGMHQESIFVIAVLSGTVCLLSLLLWATPNVYAELEGKNWTFVTSRPHGRWSILFGKFLLAVFWSFVIGWTAMSLSLVQISAEDVSVYSEDYSPPPRPRFTLPMDMDEFTPLDDMDAIDELFAQQLEAYEQQLAHARANAPPRVSKLHVWGVFSILIALASTVYAAVFSFFGVISQRRAMAFAVGYFLIFEIMLAVLPANVGKLTMTPSPVLLANPMAGLDPSGPRLKRGRI